MSDMSDMSDSDYILSSSSDPNPEGAQWITLGRGSTDLSPGDFEAIKAYFTGIALAGAIALEKGKEGHIHCHVAIIRKRLPDQWRRDLHNALKWGGKRESKWFQLHKPVWSDLNTWQNRVGGYMAKGPIASHQWGIHPQYLLQGKVTYTGLLQQKTDKKELNQSNYIRVICAVGRRAKAKTVKEAFKACLAEKYKYTKLHGRIHWDSLEQDYQNAVWGKEPDLHLAMEHCSSRW